MSTLSNDRRNLRLPKLCGADVELGNFIEGSEEQGGTGSEASRALLREFSGFPVRTRFAGCGWSVPQHSGQGQYHGWGYGYWNYGTANGTACTPHNPQDWGRKFSAENGSCVYIDLDHLEICLPEVISAWDHVAVWHAMLRITRQALHEANDSLQPGRCIQVLVNNSDGLNNSYGSHLNFLISRQAWDNLFLRKMHQLLFLASYQVSSIVFSGLGKVGSENGAPKVPYQLSQRADFFETLLGPQTTWNRPVINSRDESLCGKNQGVEAEYARLHVISFDNTLAHVSSLLKVGVTQIILAMIETEFVNPNLVLENPVQAFSCYSHDPALGNRARTVNGQYLTALELQFLFLEEAVRFEAGMGFDGIVPGADEILFLWEDTLLKLENRQFSELRSCIDWVLKLHILERAMAQQPELSWDSPEIKYLDQLYSSLDEREGLYWIYEKGGYMQNVVSDEHIERFVHNPPEDTRAYARAMLLRSADPADIDSVDWDSIGFSIRRDKYWSNRRTVDLGNPLSYTKEETERCFRESGTLEEILDALDAMEGKHRPEPNAEANALSTQSMHTN